MLEALKAKGWRVVRDGTVGSYPATGKVLTPEAAAEVAKMFQAEPAEVFAILMLDTAGRMIGGGPQVISRGILTETMVHPREVFAVAIPARAFSIVLIHTHPGGDATPSKADIEVTKQLVEAGELLNVPVSDHIILAGDGRWASLRRLGYL